MKSLDVAISGARIKSWVVTIPSRGSPEVLATIDLMAPNGNKVSGFTHCRLDLPAEVQGQLDKLSEMLEGLVADQCQSLARELPPMAEVVP